MPRNIERGRVIYHYRLALEKIADEPDLYPRRLFTVMHPLFQVSVRGHERRGEDYEELEWFIIRAVGSTQLESITALKEFYGLDEQIVRHIVDVLKTIGHLTVGIDGHLALTPLGKESLVAKRRYEEYESRQLLYFDAYTCHPLPSTHYGPDFLDPAELRDEDKALYSFEPWQPDVLENLAKRPDRAEYNIPEEVQKLEQLDSSPVSSAYIPMHIVEVIHRGNNGLRVFSNIRGRRDDFFRSLLENHPSILRPLLDDHRPPQEVIGYGLAGMKLPKGSYKLERAPDGEWRVIVPERWAKGKRPDGAKRLADLGEYVRAADYCVRLWSDSRDLRYEAACYRVLNKLEHIYGEPSPNKVSHHVNSIFKGLEAPIAEVKALLKMAQEQGMGGAQERLESLLDTEKETNPRINQ